MSAPKVYICPNPEGESERERDRDDRMDLENRAFSRARAREINSSWILSV